MEDEAPFETEEVFGADDVPADLAGTYSVHSLAERWLQPRNDSFATKIWAAGRLRDLRYASLEDPSDAAMAALAMKAALVVLAARMGEHARVMGESREVHFRLAPTVATVARRILMPPDHDGHLSQYLDNRVSATKAILNDYAASGEVTWLSLLPGALDGDAKPPFLEAPEVVHADLIRLDGASQSLAETLDRFAVHLRGMPQTGGRITVRAATDAVMRHIGALLESDAYLKASDIFEFESLASAVARRDAGAFFAQLSDLMANRAGREFDERGHPIGDNDAPSIIISYPAAAPFLARALQAWNARGELQRKLLDGKHLPSVGASKEALARASFSPQRSPYTELRLDGYDPEPQIVAGINRMQQDSLFTKAATAKDPGEFIYSLRAQDSPQVIEDGGGGSVVLRLLRGNDDLRARVTKHKELFYDPAAHGPPAKVAPNGSERFSPPSEAYPATPVPFNAATFMIEHHDPKNAKPKKQYVRGVKVRTPLLGAMLYAPNEIHEWLTDESKPPRTQLRLPARANFTGRRGWTVYPTATDACELAVAGETAPVVVADDTVGYVRVVDVVRLDSRPASHPAELPRVHMRGLVGSTWFAPIDTPNKVNARRDLFANGGALLRSYLTAAENLLRTNRVWFIDALKDSDALRNLAVHMFGTHEISQGRAKPGEKRPSVKRLGRRAGPADEAALFYAQIGLGNFFRPKDPSFAPVLQIVGLAPLLFRINENRLIVFPNVVPSTASPPEPAAGWAQATARQWRTNGTAATIYWTRMRTDSELLLRVARASKPRAPITLFESEDQYGQWLALDAVGTIDLAEHRVEGQPTVPSCLIYNERHYVWIAEQSIYAAQDQTYEYYEVALLYAGVALRLATESFANLEPLRSPGSPAWTRPGAQLSRPPPPPVAPLPPAPEELLSFAGTEPLPFAGRPSPLDALYSYTVASAVLRHADADDAVRARYYRIVERIGELVERGTVDCFFRDACYSSTNRTLLSAFAEFDVLFDVDLFAWPDASLPDGFVRQAIADPLRDLEAVHLSNDPVHQLVASSMLRLAAKPRVDLLEEMQRLEPGDAGEYCSRYGLHWVCEDMVRTMIQDSKTDATFMSAAFVRDWFFRPHIYDGTGIAHTQEVAWLGFDLATARSLRAVPDGFVATGLCALYSLAEARRSAANVTLPF